MVWQRKNDKKSVGCPVDVTIHAIGGRWMVLVIHHLLEGAKRFRELEDRGVIDRYLHQQIPSKMECLLTSLESQLKPILIAMHDWGEAFEKRRHAKSKGPSPR